MWVFWPIMKLFKYSRILNDANEEKLDLFFGKLDDVPVDFSRNLFLEFFCVKHK